VKVPQGVCQHLVQSFLFDCLEVDKAFDRFVHLIVFDSFETPESELIDTCMLQFRSDNPRS
jgi:hypothetical protein